MAGTGDDAEQSFVRQVVALHDKYRLVRPPLQNAVYLLLPPLSPDMLGNGHA